MRVLGLGSGCGGMERGAILAGCQVVGFIERDPVLAEIISDNFQCPVFRDVPEYSKIPRFEIVSLVVTREPRPGLDRLLSDLRPMVVVAEERGGRFYHPEYPARSERMDYSLFGIPQVIKRTITVAYRFDVRTIARFAFPDPVSSRLPVRGFLDESPDDGLRLPDRVLANMALREARNLAAGFRYKARIITPDETCPMLPPRYAKDRMGVLLGEGHGGVTSRFSHVRKFSVEEVGRIMGLPKSFLIRRRGPTAVRAMLSTPPPLVFAEIFREVLLWTP